MFSDPQKNIEQLRIEPGTTVADIGSGAGFYTMAAAQATGEKGKVYAIDVLKELLEKLKNEARRSHLLNIETIWGNAEKLGGTRLADLSVDVALVCNTLFQLEHKTDFPFEIKRILKVGGRVLIVDWKESFGGMGPQPQHVFTSDMTRKLFEPAGFTFDREISAGAHHYGLVFHR